VAPLLFRASPIDPALRSPPSTEPSSRDLASYNNSSLQIDGHATPNNLHPAPGLNSSTPSSESTPSSTTLPRPSALDSRPDHNSYGVPPSLPGLSALASVASAPTSQIRYASLRSHGKQEAHVVDAWFLRHPRPPSRKPESNLPYLSRRSSSNNSSNVTLSMSYATSSPAATTGGQGNTPVSLTSLSFFLSCLHTARGGACRAVISCGWRRHLRLGAGGPVVAHQPSIPYRTRPSNLSRSYLLQHPHRIAHYQPCPTSLSLLSPQSPSLPWISLLFLARNGVDHD
jgi:hypothetical protein